MEQAELVIESDDLDLFSDQEDLFQAANTRHFDSARLDQAINDSANRALQVCNAQAQLMLATWQSANEDGVKVAQVKAEHIAYDLGDSEYDPDQPRDNPFEEAVLADAWQQGYDAARSAKRYRPLHRLEEKFWEQGIDTEDARSQYELCALQLFRIARHTDTPAHAERAKRLAMEMCRYHEGETPSATRQQEIDSFMAKQTARMAQDLDF